MKPNTTIAARILRVNHGGETGAIHIYRTQIRAASWAAPDLKAFLQHALAHEIEHRAIFRSLMPDRNSKPCRLMWIWGVGGTLLGAGSALLGREGILACTQVVERTVHRHLDDQIAWASDNDPVLAQAIKRIQVEELDHLAFAEAERRSQGLAWFSGMVASATEALIWLSTRGDSSRLSKALRSA